MVWDEDSSVVIRIGNTRFTGWKKLGLFDGAQKVGRVVQGTGPNSTSFKWARTAS